MEYKYHQESYNDYIGRLFGSTRNVLPITFQVTNRCNLSCTYCYQTNKHQQVMNFNDAKKMIDLILDDDSLIHKHISPGEKHEALCLEFIGGEPFLEIELIEQICDYFIVEAIKKHHRFASNFVISLCSNGILYNTPQVQHFLHKYEDNISLTITIDGCKELHDQCRIFPDGSPSYDIAIAAAKDWEYRHPNLNAKVTISPDNLSYLYDGILNMVQLNYKCIFANTVFEAGWTNDLAKQFYYELKKIADYFNDNDLVEEVELSLFQDDFFKPKDIDDNENWCGGNADMLAMDPNGNLFTCIRYMETSLNNEQPEYIIGNINDGLCSTPEEEQRLKCLHCLTRRSQSTDECFYCPIAAGCAWCSGYNYQVNGTPNKRVTYICCMHKARALANVYFWNKYYLKHNINKTFEMHCPKEWALEIIDKDEYNMLLELTKRN